MTKSNTKYKNEYNKNHYIQVKFNIKEPDVLLLNELAEKYKLSKTEIFRRGLRLISEEYQREIKKDADK